MRRKWKFIRRRRCRFEFRYGINEAKILHSISVLRSAVLNWIEFGVEPGPRTNKRTHRSMTIKGEKENNKIIQLIFSIFFFLLIILCTLQWLCSDRAIASVGITTTIYPINLCAMWSRTAAQAQPFHFIRSRIISFWRSMEIACISVRIQSHDSSTKVHFSIALWSICNGGDFSISIFIRISWARFGWRDDARCRCCVRLVGHVWLASFTDFDFIFKLYSLQLEFSCFSLHFSLCLDLFLASPCHSLGMYASLHRPTTFFCANSQRAFSVYRIRSYFSCWKFFDFCFLYNLKFSFWLFYGSSVVQMLMEKCSRAQSN